MNLRLKTYLEKQGVSFNGVHMFSPRQAGSYQKSLFGYITNKYPDVGSDWANNWAHNISDKSDRSLHREYRDNILQDRQVRQYNPNTPVIPKQIQANKALSQANRWAIGKPDSLGYAIPGSQSAMINLPTRSTIAHESFHGKYPGVGQFELPAYVYGGWAGPKAGSSMVKRIGSSIWNPFIHSDTIMTTDAKTIFRLLMRSLKFRG